MKHTFLRLHAAALLCLVTSASLPAQNTPVSSGPASTGREAGATVTLVHRGETLSDRIKYWMSVGALPSEKVQVILDKFMKKFEEAAKQAATPPAPAAG